MYAASEVAGFAKTGGLADVAGSLPRALAERGVDCAVFLPLYRSARLHANSLEATGQSFSVRVGAREVAGTLFRSVLPGSQVPVFLIDQPDYFDRDDPTTGKGLYQLTSPDGTKADYPDNCERFVFFSKAILEAIRVLDFWPDVLHVNDWQTGLVPVYLHEVYRQHPKTTFKPKYAAIKTLITIHNLAYQGLFWHFDMPLLGLPWRLFNLDQLEFHGKINFLKAGIVFSDLLTTVSPTYAKEIQTRYYGCGLEGVLLARTSHLTGIVNGVDYAVWDPATDPHLAANYDEHTVMQGKAACKKALQEHFNLAHEPRTPLLGMVSRLADQKGLDLVVAAAKWLLAEDNVQIVILGEGEARYHQMLEKLRQLHPAQVGVAFALDEMLAHQIEAGADAFLMPSQFEPCGLNQMYSLNYGTPPIVRATGGLADTVVDATPENVADDTATGFAFIPYSPEHFHAAVQRALAMYRERPGQWLRVQRAGMRQDWSWNRSAAEYVKLYEKLSTLP
ncbi:MAG: glycogen synthase GlgA [Gemmataceae bacterium]|nr:glycogen synthase GlgA [Gemmataceae bacterium]